MKQQTKNHQYLELSLGLVVATVVSGVLFKFAYVLNQDRLGLAASNKDSNMTLAVIVALGGLIVLASPIYHYFRPRPVLYALILISGIVAIPILVLYNM